jgi:hypothetical protein
MAHQRFRLTVDYTKEHFQTWMAMLMLDLLSDDMSEVCKQELVEDTLRTIFAPKDGGSVPAFCEEIKVEAI